MDKRAILAVVISLGIWVGWQKIYLEPYQRAAAEQQRVMEEARAKSKEVVPVAREARKEAAPVFRGKEARKEKATLDLGESKVTVSNGNDFLLDWSLDSFHNSMGDQNDLVTLEKISGVQGQLQVRFSDERMNQILGAQVLSGEGRWSTTHAFRDATVRKELFFGESPYFARVNVHVSFSGQIPKFVFLDLLGSTQRANDKEGSIFGEAPDKVHITWRNNNGRESVIGANLKEMHESLAGAKWLGVDTKYFALALVPDVPAVTGDALP
ncbi:MAG: hypothetical protein HUU37_06990 [Bdellovibrionales bacterium]|nr:hypothetical protein [Bdellovibrionales bacterium]